MNDPQQRADLMAEEVTVGLAGSDWERLKTTLENSAGLKAEFEGLEAAAAALHVHFVERDGVAEMPTALRTKILRQAATQASRSSRAVQDRPPYTAEVGGRRWKVSAFLGWAVAAALALAFLTRTAPERPSVVPPTLTALRGLEDTVSRPFEELAPQYAGVRGEVVWNEKLQQGFMVIEGLEPNDPTQSQFQLWIKDSARKGLVDGGVFDIASKSTVIPITPKLRVTSAAAFVITREPPHGVVVSEQKDPVLIAKR